MEKNNLVVFENEQFGKVRTVLQNGEPWFVGKDVAQILGYTNPQKAIRDHVDAEDKGVNETFTPGGKQRLPIINESGLYSLILSSKLPTARAFKRWVTAEVLPSIRKHGTYMADAVIEHLNENPELVPEYLQRLLGENAEARRLREQLGQAKPKAEYYDAFVSADDLTCFRYTAKELGVPQKKLMGYLVEHGYLYRDRHRDGRTFVRASRRNDPLFDTRDFYTPGARKSEYTLVTPAGKEYLKALVPSIRAWKPKDDKSVNCTGEEAAEAAVFANKA